jgi:PAS domain S-box-containing protein
LKDLTKDFVERRRGRLMMVGGLASSITVLLLFGMWLGAREADRRDAGMREGILSTAVHMAGTINLQHAKQLTFTSLDRDLPAFQRIRDHMCKEAQEIGHASIYSMALRKDKLFFGPETYAVNDPLASPPGSQFFHPSAEYFRIFKSGTPIVFGPAQDEFGKFVTALAPVLDESGKRVIMVIGVDVPAEDWEASLASVRMRPVILTGVLGTFLLLAVAFTSWNVQRIGPLDLRVRRWVMIPAALAVAVAMALYGMYEYQGYRQAAHTRMHELQGQTIEKWNAMLAAQIQGLRGIQDHLMVDGRLRKSWAAGDTVKLRATTAMLFDSLKNEEGITQLTCIGTDKRCLARGQAPEVFGDRIERSTLELSEISGTDAWGVEPGARGTLAFRFVRASTADGRSLGSIEVGKDVDQVVRRFVTSMHIDAIGVLEKDQISEPYADAAGRLGAIRGDWDTYSSVVLINNTLPAVPAEVETMLVQGSMTRVQTRVFEAELNGREYACGIVPVSNVHGNVLISLIVLHDVTNELVAAWRRTLIVYGFVIVLMSGVLVLLWAVTGKVQTQLSRSFRELQKSESRFKQVAERSLTVTWEVDADGLFTYVSDASLEVLGYTPEELVGKIHFYNIHPPDGREQFRDAALEVFATKQPFLDLPNAIERKDGGVIWVSTTGIPILGHGEELLGYQGTDTDITERRKNEEALLASESRLRAITQSAQDGIIMMDPRGSIEFWNPAAERLFGYSAAEVMGQNLHTTITPKRYHKAHHHAFTEFLMSGKGSAVGRNVDMDGLRKDGQEFNVQLSLSAVHLQDGWHAIGLLRDVTEQREIEAERERAHQELQDVLNDLREANIALEEATARANALAGQAEAANVAKSQFLANMSHEIRTPMNGIIGMTGLLADSPLQQEQKQFVDVIRTSSEALLSLINDILDFSKIEAHKIELDDIEFNLPTVLEETTELLAVKAHEKDLNIVCLIDPDVPQFVRGDSGRVRQVILNLGGNAVKFTQEGSVSIHASMERMDEGRPVVRFAITDSGVGIPKEKQAKLFAPFTQVDGSITRKFGGTGLGLAISKQLAELMGGTIGMESPARSPVTGEFQQGSTFWFTIMFHPVEVTVSDAPAIKNVLEGIRVLVVDDSEANRFLVRTLLNNWGCRSGEAINGEHALEVLEEAVTAGDPFEFAVMDLVMPGIDGAEVGKRVKALQRLNKTHLVMMTSLGEQGDRERMLQIGFAAYFTKPFRQNQLKEAMESILNGTQRTVHHDKPPAKTVRAVQSSARILIAEDNQINQLVALKILAKLGYRADTVANGAEAVDAVADGSYDIILMDCQMPEMDGFEATRVLREKNMQIPIIAMTANAMKGDRELCIAAGMNDYISKPVKSTELGSILERWLAVARV